MAGCYYRGNHNKDLTCNLEQFDQHCRDRAGLERRQFVALGGGVEKMLSGQIVTANRLDDGVVVFLSPRNDWVEALRGGGVWTDTASATEALAAAKQDEARDIIVEPYLIDVVDKNGAVGAKHLREIIRAAGPTIRRDLGKQAALLAAV
jgi:Protein of unknown function (DUF2849)